MSINFNNSYFSLLPDGVRKMTGDYLYGKTSMLKDYYHADDTSTPLKITFFAPQTIMKTYTDYYLQMKFLIAKGSALRTWEGALYKYVDRTPEIDAKEMEIDEEINSLAPEALKKSSK